MRKLLYFLLLSTLGLSSAYGQTQDHYPDSIHPGRLRTVIFTESAFYLAGNSYLQFVWYKNHESVPFHFYNDNKGWLQMDKAGHAYGAYHYSHKGYHALRWAGVSRKKALIYGGALGLVLQTPIEVFDGLYEGYGFSVGDMVANTAGSALFTVQQALWDQQIVSMKFSYSPSGYPQYNPYSLGSTPMQSFFSDYNGHTYWLSTNLHSIFPQSRLPKWLNLAVGYSGNGMLKEFENPEYIAGKDVRAVQRYRQYVLALDIDLSRVHTRSQFLNSVLRNLNMIKVPLPAIEYCGGLERLVDVLLELRIWNH
jgi:hypothetical protein